MINGKSVTSILYDQRERAPSVPQFERLTAQATSNVVSKVSTVSPVVNKEKSSINRNVTSAIHGGNDGHIFESINSGKCSSTNDISSINIFASCTVNPGLEQSPTEKVRTQCFHCCEEIVFFKQSVIFRLTSTTRTIHDR